MKTFVDNYRMKPDEAVTGEKNELHEPRKQHNPHTETRTTMNATKAERSKGTLSHNH